MNSVILPNGVIMGFRSYGSPIRKGNANSITIGKYVSIAEGVIFDSGFQHDLTNISNYPFHMVYPEIRTNIPEPRNIVIGNDVWLGTDVMIMEGVRIDDGAVIGARSVLTKGTYVGAYQVWAGTPAKFIKHRFSYLDLNKGDTHHSRSVTSKLLKLSWWNKEESEVHKIAFLLVSGDFDELFKHYNL